MNSLKIEAGKRSKYIRNILRTFKSSIIRATASVGIVIITGYIGTGCINYKNQNDYIKKNRNEVIIATIDFGINPELQIFKNSNIIATPEYTETSQQHGTMVNSVIVNTFTEFPEYSKNIKIMPINIMHFNGNLKNALEYAIVNGAKVVNISLGQNSISEDDYIGLKNAINKAYENNIVVVAACGDSGNAFQEDYPALISKCISVGSVDKENQFMEFTNYNENIDIVELGNDVDVYNTDGKIVKQSGTSFSTPKVSAYIAMLYAHYLEDKKEVTVNSLKSVISETADDLNEKDWDLKTGWGKINFNKAINSKLPVSKDVDRPVIHNIKLINLSLNESYISFEIDDDNKIDIKNSKFLLNSNNKDNSTLKQKQITITENRGKYISEALDISDGEYIFDIYNISSWS